MVVLQNHNPTPNAVFELPRTKLAGESGAVGVHGSRTAPDHAPGEVERRPRRPSMAEWLPVVILEHIRWQTRPSAARPTTSCGLSVINGPRQKRPEPVVDPTDSAD